MREELKKRSKLPTPFIWPIGMSRDFPSLKDEPFVVKC